MPSATSSRHDLNRPACSRITPSPLGAFSDDLAAWLQATAARARHAGGAKRGITCIVQQNAHLSGHQNPRRSGEIATKCRMHAKIPDPRSYTPGP
jgi:hypothetical protein